MAKVRVYELARELGVENKVLIAKAQELGMSSIRSHSNSISGDEADNIRRSFIREAIGSRPDSEVVKTSVDSETGETNTIVERRKGDVVRRRRRVVEDTPAASEPVVQAEALDSQIDIQETTEVAVEESQEQQELDESMEAAAVSEATEEPASEELDDEELEDDKKKAGPKVLGKIDLPQQRIRPAKQERQTKVKSITPAVDLSNIDDDEDSKRKRKRSKKREFSRGDLVDYQGRPTKKAAKGGKAGKRGAAEEIEEDAKPEITVPKAAKRIIKMASEVITVGELAKQMSLKAGDVIGKLISLGVMATINQAIDSETATIVADEFGYSVEFTGFDEEDILEPEGVDDPAQMQSRPPVVTVMGHVDHGKTSLLDYIRKASVAAKEHGGITQHIGAYTVSLDNSRSITFVDTPGHAAFTSMRARGAQITDVVILVVAADDGVMPQTIEAINHAKAAEVSIVVAINKMDRPNANPDKIKQQLAERGIQPEDWGGDVMCFPVSALSGDGVEELLEGVLLVSEILELKANASCRVKGTILEARQEKGRGTVATVLVQAGTLKVGDIYIAGAEFGRVRSMVDHQGAKVEAATPSTPVEITGLNGVPIAGDDFVVVESEASARQVAGQRKERQAQKDALNLAGGPVSLEEFAKMAQRTERAELTIILKADVQGSLEAVRQSVEELSTEKVNVKVLHGAVGGVNESDVQLAIASKSLIVGFGVRGEPRALAEAEGSGVEVRFYRVIYELIDDVKTAMAGLLAPIRQEKSLARVEVREIFSVPKIGVVAGCYVLDGMVKRGANIRLLRDARIVHEGSMLNLRRFKDDVKEVQSGYECGISIQGYNDIQTGDVMEIYEFEEIAATID